MNVEDDKFRRPKEVEPSVTEIIKNSEYWNKRRLHYLGDDIYFDQEIRTGVCYLCKRDGRIQKSKKTALHHLKYDHSDKLAWTIEVCNSCHWQIDPKNRRAIAKSTGREIPAPRGEFYLNKEQKKKQEEEDKRGWYKRYCMNLSGKFIPMPEFIPTQELYDKVVKAIKEDKDPFNERKMTSKKEKTAKRETMSDVSHRYW